MQTVSDFYWMAGSVGCVQGGIQALSRSYYARMIPPNRDAEFFGFYNMVGKFSAILGPLLVGVVANATGNPRLSLLAILLLFVAGAVFLILPAHYAAKLSSSAIKKDLT